MRESMRFHFNAIKFYFQLGVLILLAVIFPSIASEGWGVIVFILIAFIAGDWAYKFYKRFFFNSAIVFDFHGVMARGDLNLEDFTDMPGMQNLVVALRRNYKVALLTNMNPELYKFYSEKFGVESLFDFVFYSGKIRVAKPESNIYKYVLKRLGVAAERMVFIDDREGNVAGARAVGIKAIHFKNTQQVITELRRLGIRI